jgi:hypothetical protein
MVVSRRVLALAGALNLTLAAGAATAQTVIVMNAPRGSTVELLYNDTAVASATVGADGLVRLSMSPADRRGRAETDASIIVDTCGDDRRRVVLYEPGLQPPVPEAGCARQELIGVFVVRDVSTFVLNVGGSQPNVRLRQGPAPEHWLSAAPEGFRPAPPLIAPRGLVLSLGGGLATFAKYVERSCGDVADCSGKTFRWTYAAGVTFWVTPNLAAEATYIRPGDATVQGTGSGHTFEGALETEIVTLGGKIGATVGRGRLYGRGGFTFHRATSTTTQTINDTTILVDDVIETIPGGTQTAVLETEGWGWTAGGGGEVWANRRIAFFGELVFATLKGGNRTGQEGALDERMTLFLGGLRIRLF